MSFPRYPKYKDSGVEWLGEVPAHWTRTNLKRIVQPDRPITYGIVQAGPHVPDGVPYVRPADMSDEDGVRSQDEILRTTAAIAQAYARSMIRTGDLVCSIGPSFGKVMLTPDWLDRANLTQGTARVAVAAPNSSRFVFWALRSGISVAQWESSIGGATFHALNLGPLSETVLVLPPPSEQAAIAAFLDRETAKIDALVTEQQRLIELLEEKRQAVISHAVTKGLNPNAPMKSSGVEWLGEIPAHWDIVPLKWLTDPERPIMYGIVLPGPDVGNGVPILKGGNVKPSRMNLESMARTTPEIEAPYARARLKTGDLVYSIRGSIGDCEIVPSALEGANITQDVARVAISSNFHAGWARWALLASPVREELASGSLGAAVRGINIFDLKRARIPTPPLEEQRAIASVLASATRKFDDLVAEAQRAICLLQERRTALISAAVTGQIDVRSIAERSAA